MNSNNDFQKMTELDRMAMFDKYLDKYVSEDMRHWLSINGFFSQAASTRFHGSYEGGLFDHSYIVMKSLLDLTEKLGLKWGREDSPFIVGMFHDLCKIDQYRRLPDGRYMFVNNTEVRGHGIKSVILLSRLMDLTEEEKDCIAYHMGAFTDREEWRLYTNAVHKHPNVLWTHTADMMASHIDGV